MRLSYAALACRQGAERAWRAGGCGPFRARLRLPGERAEHTAAFQAARALGASWPRLVFRHAALNAFPPLLTSAALAMSGAILLEASLSVLGLGQQPPDPSLGNIVNGARPWMREAWWYMAFPASALILLMLFLNLLSDAINDATSPMDSAAVTVGWRRQAIRRGTTGSLPSCADVNAAAPRLTVVIAVPVETLTH